MQYMFTLRYQLSPHDRDVESLTERLRRICTRNTKIGISRDGAMTLVSVCDASDMPDAMCSVIMGVEVALPTAKFLSWTRRIVRD